MNLLGTIAILAASISVIGIIFCKRICTNRTYVFRSLGKSPFQLCKEMTMCENVTVSSDFVKMCNHDDCTSDVEYNIVLIPYSEFVSNFQNSLKDVEVDGRMNLFGIDFLNKESMALLALAYSKGQIEEEDISIPFQDGKKFAKFFPFLTHDAGSRVITTVGVVTNFRDDEYFAFLKKVAVEKSEFRESSGGLANLKYTS